MYGNALIEFGINHTRPAGGERGREERRQFVRDAESDGRPYLTKASLIPPNHTIQNIRRISP